MKQTIITAIQEAIRLANVSVYLGLLAIVCFCVFGTLASMTAFKDSQWVYLIFHYLPYVLIGISIPISLYHGFVLARYRIVQMGILLMVLLGGVGMLLFSAGVWFTQGTTTLFFMSLFLTMVAWFGMPFLFRVNLKKFLAFLQDDAN